MAIAEIMTETDVATKTELAHLSNVSKISKAASKMLMLRRALRFEEQTQSESTKVVAERWGVKDTHLSHVQYGTSMGAFLARLEATFDVSPLTDADVKRMKAAGVPLVSNYLVIMEVGGEQWSAEGEGNMVDALLKAASTTDIIPLTDSETKNGVVKSMLDRANTVAELQALRVERLKLQESRNKQPELVAAAIEALTEITAPSAELIELVAAKVAEWNQTVAAA